MEEIEASSIVYSNTESLTPEQHGRLHIDDSMGFSYARSATILQINIVEFMACVRHYPILFGSDDKKMPVILTGIEGGLNLFIDDAGNWNDGCYIPASVRRYPFILQELEEGIRLCIDTDSMNVNKHIGIPLFEKGVPTDMLATRAKFAATYSREQARTYAFVQECERRELLVPRNVDITLKDGRKVSVRGFLAIDSEKFSNLPDDAVKYWWDMGYLGLAYAHFNSLANFGRLFYKTHSDHRGSV